MMFCKDCGRRFTDNEALPEMVDDVEIGYVDLCPYCGSENISRFDEDKF